MRLQNFNSGVGATGSSPTTPNPNTNTTNQMPSNFNQMAQNNTPKPASNSQPNFFSKAWGGLVNVVGDTAKDYYNAGASAINAIGGAAQSAGRGIVNGFTGQYGVTDTSDKVQNILPKLEGNLSSYVPGTADRGQHPFSFSDEKDTTQPAQMSDAKTEAIKTGVNLVVGKGIDKVGELAIEKGTGYLESKLATRLGEGSLQPIVTSVPFKGTKTAGIELFKHRVGTQFDPLYTALGGIGQ
jgi:hypothetical protein